MILDYKENLEFALVNGIKPINNIGEVHFVNSKECKGITFMNFPHLCIDDVILKDCIFKNCNEITFSQCDIKDCIFENINNINGLRSDFCDCNFRDCRSDGPFLVIDSQGCTHRCIFDSITCTSDQGYVIYSVYGKKSDIEIISDCMFINCTTESEDGKLCYCAYFKPFSSFRTVRTDNVDHDTCDFVKHAENDT